MAKNESGMMINDLSAKERRDLYVQSILFDAVAQFLMLGDALIEVSSEAQKKKIEAYLPLDKFNSLVGSFKERMKAFEEEAKDDNPGQEITEAERLKLLEKHNKEVEKKERLELQERRAARQD